MIFPFRSVLLDADPGAAGGGAPSAPPSLPASSSVPSSAPSAPLDGAGGTDFDSAFDSVMASVAPAAPAPAGQTGEVAPPAAAGSPAEAPPAVAPATSPEQTPGAEAPAEGDQAAEEDPLAELAIDDDTADDEALADPAKPNLLDLKKPRGQRIYQSYKAYKAFSEALGHEPTVEDIQDYYTAFSDQAAMVDEFLSGDPAKAANFAAYWNGLDPTGNAMSNLAGALPDFLANSGNQNAYMALAMPIINRFIQTQYALAQRETVPELRDRRLFMAQMADWAVNDKFRQGADLAQAATPQLDQREAQVNAKFQQIQQYEAAQHEQANTAFLQSVDAAADSALQAAVDPIMKPLQAALPKRVFDATKREFTEAVKQHLAKDVEANRLAAIRANQALRTRSSEDQEALVSAYLQRASRAIRALAPAFLKEAGVAAVTQNAQTHTQLAQQAKAGAAPNAAGRPVVQSILPTPQQYASKGDQMDATIDQLLGLAPGRR